MAAHHRQLQEWAENCPENFENRAALVGAEIARLNGREFDAERLYERAIQSARANGFVHNEALASEVAARFYAAHGLETNAQAHLRNARHCYLIWGADGKVRRLDQLHPHLRHEERAPGPIGTIGAPVEHLDLATVIKVSQAISAEIVLEKLIDTLMRTAIEQAGAERGLLILPRRDDLRIEAEATTSGDTVVVHLCDEPVNTEALPELVLHFVLRTQDSVILDDAAAESTFSSDAYIRERRARSILCLPFINQGKLNGALYLENSLIRGAFAPARIAVLKLLASQAAIALENTHLYRGLAEREAKIRRLVDANIIGIFIGDFEGRIFEANDAFLRIVGYDREDLMAGRIRWNDLTPSDWRERDAQWIREHRLTGLRTPIEKEYFRKDGSRVPILLGSATFEEGGDQTVSFVLDLTERKQAEAVLRERETKIRRLFDSNIIGIFIWKLEGQIVEANDAFLRIVGYDREDLAAGRLNRTDLTPLEWRELTDRAGVELKMTGTIQPYEKEYFRKDGSRVPILFGAATLEGGANQGVAFVLDLSESKRAEAEARESERRYREVQTELAHANRVTTMGQLTASIAHEVRQPIFATISNAQAALNWLGAEPPNLEEAREALDRIVRDGDRAAAVVGRISALFKKAPPRNDSLEINKAIREVIELAHGEAEKNGVSVRTDLADGLPFLRGDRVHIQQVILARQSG